MSIRKKVASCIGVLAILTVFTKVSAQFYIGAEVGGNQNYLVTNVSSLNSTEIVPKNGLVLSAVLHYKVNDWFSLEATPGFIQKNYQIQRTGYYKGVYQRTRNNYLQLPVSAKFYFGTKKWKGFVDLGGYAAYWASSHIKGAMPNILNQPAYNPAYNQYVDPPNGPVVFSQTVFDDYTPYYYSQKYQFNKTKDRRLEFGVSTGLGINYVVSPKTNFFAEFKYFNSLTDQQKNYQYGQDARYNETGTILIGFLYNLNIKIKKQHKGKSITETKK